MAPVAPWSFMFGMLTILVSLCETRRIMLERVSSSPKKSTSTYVSGSYARFSVRRFPASGAKTCTPSGRCAG